MEASTANKRFLLMSPPYSLMKSALLWAGFHCWVKWILQSPPVLWVLFSSHCVMGTEQKGNEGTFYNAGTGAEKCVKGKDLFHKLTLWFSWILCLLLELWIHSQAAELSRADMGTCFHCRNSRKKDIKEVAHATAACLITLLMTFRQQHGMHQMTTQRDGTPLKGTLSLFRHVLY